MDAASFAHRGNLDVIEANYQRWRQNPSSVDASWHAFFAGFELGMKRLAPSPRAPLPTGEGSWNGVQPLEGLIHRQTSVVNLIDAYRGLGHLQARLDPLSPPPKDCPMLALDRFGLTEADLDKTFDTSHFLGMKRGSLRELVAALRETYSRSIGVEYMHMQDNDCRHWLQEKMEPVRNRPQFARRQKLNILMELHFAELFEKFLHTHYLGQKRFSLEGGETLVPLLNHLVEKAADWGVREIVMGMAHRGRLNVLANIIGKPYHEIFSEFEENYLPNSMAGDGDVKYHLGFSSDRISSKGNTIHLSLTPNPSHLEVVNPVVEGRTRAKQRLFHDEQRVRSLPLLLHGDAAFAGQGLVAETLNLSQLTGYKTGGTVHVIINNQIGFTTSPSDARSTRYCTDVAKMIETPIFHVNGEDPEATVFAAALAFEFRQSFHRDVVIDMYCYRRHGHNEGDEPTFTQPLLYAKIDDRPGLSEIYTEHLVMQGDLTVEETQAITQEFKKKLDDAKSELKKTTTTAGMGGHQGQWKSLNPQYSNTPVETGVPLETLQAVGAALTHLPEGFTPHAKIAKFLQGRQHTMNEHKPIDWAFAEALAFGSLLLEGNHVRLSGQDSSRGTFSQRHAVIVDQDTGAKYFPLQNVGPDQAEFSVYDSLLSEAAVLGFDFGYSLDSPQSLILWEAQFGDFVNGAQVVIDQYLVCSYSKWQRDSGLVLLLPHGYEGQGPEHSSGRLERFLQQCAEDNIQVANATTPAQYFHLLRRQLRRNFRKPLVLMTPKSLLRHKLCLSPIEDLTRGHFQEVLDDSQVDPSRVRRVVLCSGKVYYDLLQERSKEETPPALVRVEQFYPFPAEQVQRLMKRYNKAREFAWVQEESLNMGGWTFMEPRLRALGMKPKYVGRDASASPATGSRQIHLREQKELVESALRGSAPHLVRSQPNQLRRFQNWHEEGLEPAEPEKSPA